MKIKYLAVNLTKNAQDLYEEIYKTLMKEIKVDLQNGEIVHVHE